MTASHSPINAAMVSGGQPEQPKRVRHFVHYETHTGQIRHNYTVVTFSGARAGADDHNWAHAQRIAARHNPDAEKLSKVILEGGEHPNLRHKIDPKTKSLLLRNTLVG